MNNLTLHLRKTLTLLILLTFSINTFGLHYSTLTVKDGLSSRRIFSITKDLKGYVWLATATSIDKYNGEKFVSYSLIDGDNESKKPKGILSDNTGAIFAYTEKQIYTYDYYTDSFIALDNIKLLNKETITSVYICENNIMWIGTTNGLYSLRDLNIFQEVTILSETRVYAITSDKSGNYWIATHNGVLKLSVIDITKLESATINFHSLKNIRIESLYFDEQNNRLWLGTFAEGLKIINTKTHTLEYDKQFDSKFPIRKIALIDSSKIWVGIDGAGIYEFSRSTPQLTREYNQTSKIKSNKIISNSIYDIKSDGSFVWVCTYSSGLMVINKETIQTTLYQTNSIDGNSISNNHVNAILEDRHSNIWFGTNNGISMYSPHSNKWKQYLQSYNKLAVILSLSEDAKGNIWAGGYASDLSIITPNTGSITKVDNLLDNVNSNRYIYSIINDEQNNIWYGGVINELAKYDWATKKTTRYEVKGINKIVNYNDSTLLIATIKGVLIFDKTTGKYERLNFNKSDQAITAFPFINGINVDPTNIDVIWVSTENAGLISYNLATKDLESFNEAKGLSSNTVYGVQFDQRNRIWISSEYGLNCLYRPSNNIKVYTQNDGLTSSTFNFLAYTKLKNGNMIWGTTDGAIETDPMLTSETNNEPINLVFEDFTIFNERITVASANSPLKEAIDETTSLEISYNQHSFSFDFININYNDSRTLYSWILEGFDTDWTTPSDNHKAIYTNIPSGNYTLKVKASDTENKTNETIREINIRINNPIWATPYAFVLYLILVTSIVYFLHRVYTNRIEARESDKKIRFFINMAHDIRTPLTLIKAPLNEIGEEPLSDSALAALDLAKKNTEKLLNMVTQLLDFQKIEREAMTLHIERTSINEFIENAAANFLMFASEKQIDFSLKLPEHNTEGWIDRKKIATILDNLLSNSIKYTSKHGNVLLKVDANTQRLTIEIIDDGIGISNLEQQKLFKRFYRADNAANSTETGSGIGLLLTKKMVALHKGKISFTSVENMGTSFKVEIPIAKEFYSDSEIITTKEILEPNIDQIEQDENSSKIKILLVEDNDDLRGYLAKYLNKNYVVREVVDGQCAIDIIPEFNPDFIISDILMPNVTGLELVHQLKSNIETCHIPIILLTSLAEREDVIKGFEVGADDYITKPFDMPILETKIQAIIRNRTLYKKKYIDRSAFEDNSQTITELDRQFMSQVLDKIEDNIANENFTIDTLALEMAMSRTVFYNKIRSLTAQSPIDLIIDVRMKKAASLLRENRYTIAEIAYLTGSTNPKYFSTSFKKYYGLTPSQFIEKSDVD